MRPAVGQAVGLRGWCAGANGAKRPKQQGGVAPNRAFSGRGCAPRRPWRQKFKVTFALRRLGRSRPAADAIVRPTGGRGVWKRPGPKPSELANDGARSGRGFGDKARAAPSGGRLRQRKALFQPVVRSVGQGRAGCGGRSRAGAGFRRRRPWSGGDCLGWRRGEAWPRRRWAWDCVRKARLSGRAWLVGRARASLVSQGHGPSWAGLLAKGHSGSHGLERRGLRRGQGGNSIAAQTPAPHFARLCARQGQVLFPAAVVSVGLRPGQTEGALAVREGFA